MLDDPHDGEEKNGYKAFIVGCLLISLCTTSTLAAVVIYLAWLRINSVP